MKKLMASSGYLLADRPQQLPWSPSHRPHSSCCRLGVVWKDSAAGTTTAATVSSWTQPGPSSPDHLRPNCLPATRPQQLPWSPSHRLHSSCCRLGRQPSPYPTASWESCRGRHLMDPSAAATTPGGCRVAIPRRRAPAAVVSHRPHNSCGSLGVMRKDQKEPSRAAAAATFPRR